VNTHEPKIPEGEYYAAACRLDPEGRCGLKGFQQGEAYLASYQTEGGSHYWVYPTAMHNLQRNGVARGRQYEVKAAVFYSYFTISTEDKITIKHTRK